MDVQSKERLTGAVILVVLIVLVVPELLRGPRSAAEPVADSAEGPPTRLYTIELGDRATTGPARPQTPAASRPQAEQQAPATAEPPVESRPVPARTPAPQPTPPATEPVRASSVEAPLAKGWSIQVGSFANRENAEREVGTLRKQGFRSFLTEGTASGGKRLYHVRVGPAPDRATAQALAGRLRSSGRSGHFLVPYP
jgi:DedD protein